MRRPPSWCEATARSPSTFWRLPQGVTGVNQLGGGLRGTARGDDAMGWAYGKRILAHAFLSYGLRRLADPYTGACSIRVPGYPKSSRARRTGARGAAATGCGQVGPWICLLSGVGLALEEEGGLVNAPLYAHPREKLPRKIRPEHRLKRDPLQRTHRTRHGHHDVVPPWKSAR